nr:MAG TPA: hypothetical protein [Caudoviricetes sp.]
MGPGQKRGRRACAAPRRAGGAGAEMILPVSRAQKWWETECALFCGETRSGL